MNAENATAEPSGAVTTFLPYLRRFARALTGSQRAGDAYAVATLETILADESVLDISPDPKVALFAVFNSVWSSSGALMEDVESPESTRAAAARNRLASLTPDAREAFLLKSLEDFPDASVAAIMGIPEDEAARLVEIGAHEMASGMKSDVLIIEDEPLIAIEIRTVVEELGHAPIGIARTMDDAVALVEDKRPDLVLADIRLADGSSGIEAVNDILAIHGDVPVIFITAYPERLLTGDRPEPTFLLRKPFKVPQLRAAIEQALFFRSVALVSV